jgi:hypothetical protein
MDEMIWIPKIMESVTCNVYKSRVCCINEIQKNYKNFFSIFSANLNTIFFLIPLENKHGIRAHKLIPKRGVNCEKQID